MDDFTLELIGDFIAECGELIDEIEPKLLSAQLLDQPLANSLFRPVHSLKGTSGSLGFLNITNAVHEAETLLSLFQKGEFSSGDNRYTAFFLKFFDFIRNAFEILRAEASDATCMEDSQAIIREARELVSLIKSSNGEGLVSPVGGAEEGQPVDDNVEEPLIKVEIDQEMVDAFIIESREIFAIVEEKLLALSKDAGDRESLNEAFRNIHSFKGNCGIFSFADFEKLSHRIENILSGIIGGEIESTSAVYFAIIPIADVLKEGIENLMDRGVDGYGTIAGLELYLDLLDEIGGKPVKANSNGLEIEKVEEKVEEVEVKKEEVSPGKNTVIQQKPLPANQTKVEQGQMSKSNVKASSASQNIRVDIAKLDILNNLVGELVTVKTMVSEHFRGLNDGNLDKTFRLFDRVATDLQDVAMSIRMIPVEGLFKKMIRIVHDISMKSGKKIDFDYFGGDTEIDKTVIEKISDPLVHMIRNAVDHGVESPHEREKLGKESAGKVTLSARNESSEIWIVITDDGKGLDKEIILQKGIEKGLVADGESLSNNDIYNLIFAPGFSTAREVTDISGRGVGMDVVKTNIDDIKGRVEIHSELGQGTIFTIKIPMTLAVIQGMIMGVGESRYIIPIESIKESVKIDKKKVSHPMENQELVDIRGDILPVIRLSELHKIETNIKNIEDGILVVAETKGRKVAILIDSLIGQCETVVKPLPGYLKNVKGVSGCSIMGSGDASLILDVSSLLDLAENKAIKMNGGRKLNGEKIINQ